MARIFVLGGLDESLVNFRRNLLEEMVAGGHQVYACAPHASDDVKKKLLAMGVIYEDINLSRTGLNPVKDLSSIISLTRLLKNIKPDIFLGYTIKPVIYGSLAARIAGIRKIFSMIEGLGYAFTGDSYVRRILGVIAKTLYKLALKFNQNVFFLNPDDLNLFLEYKLISKRQQAVLLNGIGIDLDDFSPAPYPQAVSFLMIARLVKDKGVLEYVEAARIISQTYPEVKFKLVGFIDENPSAINKKDLLSWQEAGVIEYLGYLRDVHQAISDCSVYILPSYREGLPRTVLEAMAMARAIITTDAPGCRETVKQGVNGYLVPVKDVAALVKPIEHFIQHSEDIQRMGQKSRLIAEEKYDVHKVNRVILDTMALHK